MGDTVPLAGIRALLIDDSNTIRRSGEIFLTQAGCQVVLAEDGYDGLAKIAEQRPDVIFIDIMMPRLDGYQTCALLKNHHKLMGIPAIMLTSKDSLYDRAWAKLVGANQYLIKPFTMKSLVDAVLAHVPPQPPKDKHDH